MQQSVRLVSTPLIFFPFFTY